MIAAAYEVMAAVYAAGQLLSKRKHAYPGIRLPGYLLDE